MIKCLVWDLDNTLWSGTLLEGDKCRLKPGIRSILEELDRRGILLSIASSNDEDLAMPELRRKGISHFFLYPQIKWSYKVSSIQVIANNLNIGLDSMGFIDDEPFEIHQVRKVLPAVKTYPAHAYKSLLEEPELNPMFDTKESRNRRIMYQQEEARARARKSHGKSRRQFLADCRTQITIRRAEMDDLPRILELMHRTHQLNATGEIYGEEDIQSFLLTPNARLYVMELKDKYVDYGKIGVAMCLCLTEKWQLVSFLLSCRVLTRGIGTFFLSWLEHEAYINGALRFEGRFRKQERNHRMRILYTLSGFKPQVQDGAGSVVFAKKSEDRQLNPGWFTLCEGDNR